VNPHRVVSSYCHYLPQTARTGRTSCEFRYSYHEVFSPSVLDFIYSLYASLLPVEESALARFRPRILHARNITIVGWGPHALVVEAKSSSRYFVPHFPLARLLPPKSASQFPTQVMHQLPFGRIFGNCPLARLQGWLPRALAGCYDAGFHESQWSQPAPNRHPLAHVCGGPGRRVPLAGQDSALCGGCRTGWRRASRAVFGRF
jgi:hypothetical protein